MDDTVLGSIPHRPPFLFVDEVVEIVGDVIRARRAVREDEPHFEGHYPGNPLMPGVLMCESVIQCGAILLSRQIEGGTEKVPILTRIQNARFKRQVRPGDVLDLEARVTERMGDAYFCRGSASVGGKKVMSLEFACALAAKPE